MDDDTILFIIWFFAIDQVLGFVAWYFVCWRFDPEKYVYNWRIFAPLFTPLVFKRLSYSRWIANRNK
jgi:hypothetical protein